MRRWNACRRRWREGGTFPRYVPLKGTLLRPRSMKAASQMRVFLVVLGLLVLGACERKPTGKYNVVLITIDSLRADHTGPYGHKPEFAPDLSVTPNLDRLAQSGAVFEDAWSSSSWTLRSEERRVGKECRSRW